MVARGIRPWLAGAAISAWAVCAAAYDVASSCWNPICSGSSCLLDGITVNDIEVLTDRILFVAGGDQLSTTDGGIYHTGDGGVSWNRVILGSEEARVNCIRRINGSWYAGVDAAPAKNFSGLWKSNDGLTWTEYMQGAFLNTEVYDVAAGPDGIYVGLGLAGNALFRIAGDSAKAVVGLPSQPVYALCRVSGTLYAGIGNAVWSIGAAPAKVSQDMAGNVRMIAADPAATGAFYFGVIGPDRAASLAGLFRYSPSQAGQGSIRRIGANGITSQQVWGIGFNGQDKSEVYVATFPDAITGSDGGFFYSRDSGATWASNNYGLRNYCAVRDIGVADSTIYIGLGFQGGLYRLVPGRASPFVTKSWETLIRGTAGTDKLLQNLALRDLGGSTTLKIRKNMETGEVNPVSIKGKVQGGMDYRLSVSAGTSLKRSLPLEAAAEANASASATFYAVPFLNGELKVDMAQLAAKAEAPLQMTGLAMLEMIASYSNNSFLIYASSKLETWIAGPNSNVWQSLGSVMLGQGCEAGIEAGASAAAQVRMPDFKDISDALGTVGLGRIDVASAKASGDVSFRYWIERCRQIVPASTAGCTTNYHFEQSFQFSGVQTALNIPLRLPMNLSFDRLNKTLTARNYHRMADVKCVGTGTGAQQVISASLEFDEAPYWTYNYQAATGDSRGKTESGISRTQYEIMGPSSKDLMAALTADSRIFAMMVPLGPFFDNSPERAVVTGNFGSEKSAVEAFARSMDSLLTAFPTCTLRTRVWVENRGEESKNFSTDDLGIPMLRVAGKVGLRTVVSHDKYVIKRYYDTGLGKMAEYGQAFSDPGTNSLDFVSMVRSTLGETWAGFMQKLQDLGGTITGILRATGTPKVARAAAALDTSFVLVTGPDTNGTLRFSLSSAPDSLHFAYFYDSTFIRSQSVGFGGIFEILAAADSLPATGTIRMRYSRPDAAGLDETKIAFYRELRIAGTDQWRFWGGRCDTSANRCSLTVSSLYSFTLGYDSAPPILQGYREGTAPAGDTVNRRIDLCLYDAMSGIEPSSISVTLDGAPLSATFRALRDSVLPLDSSATYGHDSVFVTCSRQTAEGKKIVLTVLDRSGNRLVDSISLPSTGSLTLSDIACYPNPSKADVFFSFRASATCKVRLYILTLSGERVRDFDLNAAWGANEIHWDGRNGAGRKVSPGVYYYRLKASSEQGGSFEALKRLAITR